MKKEQDIREHDWSIDRILSQKEKFILDVLVQSAGIMWFINSAVEEEDGEYPFHGMSRIYPGIMTRWRTVHATAYSYEYIVEKLSEIIEKREI